MIGKSNTMKSASAGRGKAMGFGFGLTAMGIVPTGVMAQAIDEARKKAEEAATQKMVMKIGEFDKHAEYLINKRKLARRALNETQSNIRKFARALSFMQATGNVIPALNLINPYDAQALAREIHGGVNLTEHLEVPPSFKEPKDLQVEIPEESPHELVN